MYGDIVRKRLIEERKNAGYTQLDLAEKLNISPSKIAKIETGTQIPDVETIGRIAELYGISVSWLFGLGQKELPTVSDRTFIDEVASGAIVLAFLATLSKQDKKVFFSGQMKYSQFLKSEYFKKLSMKQQIYLYQEYQNQNWEGEPTEDEGWMQFDEGQQLI